MKKRLFQYLLGYGVSLAVAVFVIVFSAFMVLGRLIAGVHWATDIVGSVFLSSGLFIIYRFMAEYTRPKKKHLTLEA